jgi:hypothetical protein
LVHVTERYGQTALPHAVTIGVKQENLQVLTQESRYYLVAATRQFEKTCGYPSPKASRPIESFLLFQKKQPLLCLPFLIREFPRRGVKEAVIVEYSLIFVVHRIVGCRPKKVRRGHFGQEL